MPAFTGTALEKDLLGVLQRTLNGDTPVLVPSAQAFYVPGTSDVNNFRFDGFITKQGTLSVASQASGAVLTLQSSHEAAQFRAGDQVYLVGNLYAGAVGAAANTADGPLTVASTSPVNQTVTVTGRAASLYSGGASLVQVAGSAPGAVCGAASAGRPAYNQWLAALLTGFQDLCGGTIVGNGGASTTTTFDVAPGGSWVAEFPSLLGATIEFLTGTAANIGCTAKVMRAAGAPVTLTLEDIKDADGDSIAALPSAPAALDTASLALDLSEGKLTDLAEAGGDMTTMISALLTMHRKLDVAFVFPEIPLVNEWNVMGQTTGTMLRSTAAYDNAASLAITVEFDQAVGDIPFPLSGTLRAINAADGVVAVGDGIWDDTAVGSVYVAYTRQKRSNVLTLTAGVGALGANFPTGSIVELNPAVNGFAKTSGFAPQANNNYISGLMWQLAEAVRNYDVLGT